MTGTHRKVPGKHQITLLQLNMAVFQPKNEWIKNKMEKEFSRVHSATDISVSLAILVAGCILVALPTSVPVNILGFFMIITGLILGLILRTGYKDNETGEKFRKNEKYFPAHCKDSISKAIASAPESIDLSEENKGNGLRLDTYYNRKTGHVFVRMYEYIPYRYQPCSTVISVEMDKADKLIK